MGNRKLTLSASAEMETLIASERSSIVDNIYKYASKKDYYTCCRECLYEVRCVLYGNAIAHTMKYIDNGLLAVIIALILNFIIIFSGTLKRRELGRVLMEGAVSSATFSNIGIAEGRKTKVYYPRSSGRSSKGRSGGGRSGGGGGFSGGSSSHGF